MRCFGYVVALTLGLGLWEAPVLAQDPAEVTDTVRGLWETSPEIPTAPGAANDTSGRAPTDSAPRVGTAKTDTAEVSRRADTAGLEKPKASPATPSEASDKQDRDKAIPEPAEKSTPVPVQRDLAAPKAPPSSPASDTDPPSPINPSLRANQKAGDSSRMKSANPSAPAGKTPTSGASDTSSANLKSAGGNEKASTSPPSSIKEKAGADKNQVKKKTPAAEEKPPQISAPRKRGPDSSAAGKAGDSDTQDGQSQKPDKHSKTEPAGEPESKGKTAQGKGAPSKETSPGKKDGSGKNTQEVGSVDTSAQTDSAQTDSSKFARDSMALNQPVASETKKDSGAKKDSQVLSSSPKPKTPPTGKIDPPAAIVSGRPDSAAGPRAGTGQVSTASGKEPESREKGNLLKKFTDTVGEAPEIAWSLSIPKVFWSLVTFLAGFIFIVYLTKILNILAENWARYRILLKGLIPVFRILSWAVIVYIIIGGVLRPPFETLITLAASLGLAVGLAAQDIIKNIFGGVVVLLDRPFVVGDKVEIGKYYGEIVNIGLRTTRLVTPDDSLIAIPNAEIVNTSLSNSNSGAHDCQTVAEFYLPSDCDIAAVKGKALRCAGISRYVYLKKPIAIVMTNEMDQGRSYIKMRLKAYVFDHRFEAAFKSEMSELLLTQLREAGIDLNPAGESRQALTLRPGSAGPE